MEKICANCEHFITNVYGPDMTTHNCKLSIKNVVNEKPANGWKQGDVMGYSTGMTVHPEYSCDKFLLKTQS